VLTVKLSGCSSLSEELGNDFHQISRFLKWGWLTIMEANKEFFGTVRWNGCLESFFFSVATDPLPRTASFQAVPFYPLRQVSLYIQRSMKDTQDVNVIVCDNVGNSVMSIKENTDISFRLFSIFLAKFGKIAQ
jgi:hypothetical protein